MSDTPERRTDFDSRDRITKLEVLHSNLGEHFDRFHDDFNKMNDNYTKHVDSNNASFAEVNKTLVNLAAAMETTRGAISDLKDFSKNMADTQNKLLNQFSLIDMHNKIIEEMKDEHKDLKAEVEELKKIESKLEGSWKTLTVVASIIAFIVSTAISIGAFQLGKSDSSERTKTSYYISQQHYHG